MQTKPQTTKGRGKPELPDHEREAGTFCEACGCVITAGRCRHGVSAYAEGIVPVTDRIEYGSAKYSEREMLRLYKRAEALAEALRGMTAAYKAVRKKPLRIVALVDAAETALAQWEKASQ